MLHKPCPWDMKTMQAKKRKKERKEGRKEENEEKKRKKVNLNLCFPNLTGIDRSISVS